MAKTSISRYSYLNIMVLVILILVAAAISGCVGAKTTTPDSAPKSQANTENTQLSAQLEFIAKAASGLIITHTGGDPIALKDERITVKREVNGKIVDGLDSTPLYGSTPEFQDAPVVETLAAGQKIRHVWKESLLIGDVLVITIQDITSGKSIINTKVTVT